MARALGALDSVFAEADEMTFNNKVDSAFQLAEPGDYSGTFGLSAPQLEDGSLEVGSDGVVSWSPDEDCAAGTYAVTVTYNYSGGLQMKTLQLAIESPDLPPVYRQWADDESVADVDGGTYNFVSAATCWAADAEQTALTYSFAAGRTAAPSGAHLDSNGHLSCTFATADAGTVYDFFIVATDSSGGYDQFRMVIPVIDSSVATPYVTEMGTYYCTVEENPDGEDPGGYLVFPTECFEFNPPSGQHPAAKFVIDTPPTHGTLTADLTGLYYVPDEGFRGLDTFWCHLEVYNTQNPSQVYASEHNIAPEYIQVGSCVDLAPAQKYGTTVATDLQEPWWQSSQCVPIVDQAVLGVGATSTVTLTLQNPWGDGVPAAGYWTLDFDSSKIRVYEGNQEIVSSHWMGAGTRTSEYVIGSQDTITLTVVAISAGAAPIQADWNVWNTIGAWPYPPSFCFGWTTRVDYTVVVVDLLVDTDRDNAVDAADEAGKTDWTPSRGAIILLNSDIDNTTTGAPDDWAGGPYAGQGDCPANNVIDGNGDVYDIGPLRISRPGMSTLPDDFVLQLWVEKPPSEDSWFGQFSAEQRVRIFLPSNGASFAEGDEGIIGPDLSDHVDFVKNPGDGQYSDSIFAGSGQIRFGIEGLIPGAMVDIKIRVTFGNFERTDTVRVKVSPFILLNNTDGVSSSDDSASVSTYTDVQFPGHENDLVDNQALRDALAYWYGDGLDANGPAADVWLQDGCEIGYVQAPYGEMPMVLALPRSQRYTPLMAQFIETQMAREDVGIFILHGTDDNKQDYGGDIECLPDPIGNSQGYFFHGNGASAFLTDFFVAQGNLNPSLAVNTNWLDVKHVDEVVSLASDGRHIAVADPEMAIGLLQWAQKVDASAVMCRNMNNYGDGGCYVSAALSCLEDYNLNTVMAPANLPSVVDDVVMATQSTRNTWWDVTPGAGNTGQETLAKGKAFTAFLTWKRYFEIHFISATQFTMWYSDTGLPGSFVSDKTNGQDTVGVVDQDEVFTSAKAFILKSWWTGGTAAVGDTFRFSADPSTDIVEIPVLFQGVYDLQGLYHGATAFSSDSVNSLVDGSIVFTPETYGPVVNYSGSGAADILHDYVDAAFQHCCGLVPEFVDARYYHDGGGSIHCATNDIRLIPESHWWL